MEEVFNKANSRHSELRTQNSELRTVTNADF